MDQRERTDHSGIQNADYNRQRRHWSLNDQMPNEDYEGIESLSLAA